MGLLRGRGRSTVSCMKRVPMTGIMMGPHRKTVRMPGCLKDRAGLEDRGNAKARVEIPEHAFAPSRTTFQPGGVCQRPDRDSADWCLFSALLLADSWAFSTDSVTDCARQDGHFTDSRMAAPPTGVCRRTRCRLRGACFPNVKRPRRRVSAWALRWMAQGGGRPAHVIRTGHTSRKNPARIRRRQPDSSSSSSVPGPRSGGSARQTRHTRWPDPAGCGHRPHPRHAASATR